MEKRIKRGWMNLRVTEILEETSDTKTFRFVDAEENKRAFDYEPGQYLTFRYDGVAEKTPVRSYTMSSSPVQKEFCAVTVKKVDCGLISNWMCDEIEVGTILRARGPIGKFCYDSSKDFSDLVMIAAGSGVTPFISIMREYLGSIQMRLLVSYRSEADIICAKEITDFKNFAKTNVLVTLSRETLPGYESGRIDAGKVEKICEGNFLQKTFMICGPDEMMADAKNILLAKGVHETHIKLESFNN